MQGTIVDIKTFVHTGYDLEGATGCLLRAIRKISGLRYIPEDGAAADTAHHPCS
jgi:hypothetical protein